MGYERSDIVESAPTTQPVIAREERVLEPYRTRPMKSKISNAVGQEGINSDVKTPVEAGETAPAESVTLSPAAAALVRKEQAFRKEQAALKLREEALEKERQEIADLKVLKEKLAKKDYSGLEKDIPYDEYTNYLIEKGAAEDPTLNEVKKLSSKVEELEKKQDKDVSDRFEAAVNERRKAVKSLVDAENSAFVRVKKAKAEEAVVQHILDTWEHESIELSPEEAAKEVEELLKEKANKWAELAEPKAEEIKVEGKDIVKELPLKPKVNTLTNNMTATGEIKKSVKSFQGMSDAERWAEARRRAEEKLKAKQA